MSRGWRMCATRSRFRARRGMQRIDGLPRPRPGTSPLARRMLLDRRLHGGLRLGAGGSITAGLIQRYPGRFSAALPMCGVLSGGVATWNTALDAEFAFQQLIDPAVSVVNITNPGANLGEALNAAAAAQKT